MEEIRGVKTDEGVTNVSITLTYKKKWEEQKGPGRPILYGTTKKFLDTFGLKTLDDLPPLSEKTNK
ncbi:SMC-Scp complex subunit ScpB [Bacillus pacificus]